MKICKVESCGKEVVGPPNKKTCSPGCAHTLNKQRGREQYTRLRNRLLARYGSVCLCCGESRREFLALDHKNGNGQKHRKELGGGTSKMFRWILKHGCPEMFQILCHNCNMSLGCYGYCPHQAEQRTSSKEKAAL